MRKDKTDKPVIDIKIIFYILLIHFLADFGLQTHDQAVNKSSDGKYMLRHVSSYALVWLIASFMLFSHWAPALSFVLITFIFHFVTDLITSNLSKPFFDKGDFHNGFVIVGVDQMAHYIQLFLTYYYLNCYL